jgi:hypothetical protein
MARRSRRHNDRAGSARAQDVTLKYGSKAPKAIIRPNPLSEAFW